MILFLGFEFEKSLRLWTMSYFKYVITINPPFVKTGPIFILFNIIFFTPSCSIWHTGFLYKYKQTYPNLDWEGLRFIPWDRHEVSIPIGVARQRDVEPATI